MVKLGRPVWKHHMKQVWWRPSRKDPDASTLPPKHAPVEELGFTDDLKGIRSRIGTYLTLGLKRRWRSPAVSVWAIGITSGRAVSPPKEFAVCTIYLRPEGEEWTPCVEFIRYNTIYEIPVMPGRPYDILIQGNYHNIYRNSIVTREDDVFLLAIHGERYTPLTIEHGWLSEYDAYAKRFIRRRRSWKPSVQRF